MKTKKLLFILNPRAGRNKPHGPLFDALAILSGAGYLIRIHETSAPGDAAFEMEAREFFQRLIDTIKEEKAHGKQGI